MTPVCSPPLRTQFLHAAAIGSMLAAAFRPKCKPWVRKPQRQKREISACKPERACLSLPDHYLALCHDIVSSSLPRASRALARSADEPDRNRPQSLTIGHPRTDDKQRADVSGNRQRVVKR